MSPGAQVVTGFSQRTVPADAGPATTAASAIAAAAVATKVVRRFTIPPKRKFLIALAFIHSVS
jgi:hypothetical protein